MLLRKCPALALLPVPALQHLPAGCMYLVPYLAVFFDYVVVHDLPLLVNAFHVQSSNTLSSIISCIMLMISPISS